MSASEADPPPVFQKYSLSQKEISSVCPTYVAVSVSF